MLLFRRATLSDRIREEGEEVFEAVVSPKETGVVQRGEPFGVLHVEKHLDGLRSFLGGIVDNQLHALRAITAHRILEARAVVSVRQQGIEEAGFQCHLHKVTPSQ